MRYMQTLDVKVKEAVKNVSKMMDQQSLSSMEQSIRDFEVLVQEGYAQPRGYNLQTIDSSMCSNDVGFNV